MIDIFQYTDYRIYLKDFYEAKKAVHKVFTHRHISMKVGFKSTGTFAQILQGKTNITTQTIADFVAFLKLGKEEADFFELLVLFNQSRSHTERKRHFEKITRFPKSKFKLVESAQFAYHEKWYYVVVREMLSFYPFRDDYKALARMVSPPILPSEAEKAIRLLENLRLIRRRPDGVYEQVDPLVTSGNEASSLAINQFMLEGMELAKAALDQLPRDQRSLSSVTLSVPEAGYKVVEEKIKGLRRELLEMAKNTPGPQRVVQVNFQIVPVSKVYHKAKRDGSAGDRGSRGAGSGEAEL